MTIHVVVITDKNRRGVFGGELISRNGGDVKLKNVRMCIYWDAKTRGVFGLAATGPTNACRISRAVPEAELDGVTTILTMTDEAWSRWEAEPWG